MVDILVYLFENYLPESCPEPDALARKLTAAGFDDEEISEALDWLAGLEQAQDVTQAPRRPDGRSQRVFAAEEQAKLGADCLDLLIFLERAEAVDDHLREMIMDRVLAMADPQVSLEKFKVVVLTVMWRRQHAMEALLLEELLAEDDEEPTYH